MRVQGSPPHMRGKANAAHPAHLHHRITPAYAGKSANTIADMPGDWDHPRMCGEKPNAEQRNRDIRGSPPRVRGKANGQTSYTNNGRITPACAGKSTDWLKTRWGQRDHAVGQIGSPSRRCRSNFQSVRFMIGKSTTDGERSLRKIRLRPRVSRSLAAGNS